jgi:hypothetical protein
MTVIHRPRPTASQRATCPVCFWTRPSPQTPDHPNFHSASCSVGRRLKRQRRTGQLEIVL